MERPWSKSRKTLVAAGAGVVPVLWSVGSGLIWLLEKADLFEFAWSLFGRDYSAMTPFLDWLGHWGWLVGSVYLTGLWFFVIREPRKPSGTTGVSSAPRPTTQPRAIRASDRRKTKPPTKEGLTPGDDLYYPAWKMADRVIEGTRREGRRMRERDQAKAGGESRLGPYMRFEFKGSKRYGQSADIIVTNKGRSGKFLARACVLSVTGGTQQQPVSRDDYPLPWALEWSDVIELKHGEKAALSVAIMADVLESSAGFAIADNVRLCAVRDDGRRWQYEVVPRLDRFSISLDVLIEKLPMAEGDRPFSARFVVEGYRADGFASNWGVRVQDNDQE